jgi:excisionase family DNA binding protein
VTANTLASLASAPSDSRISCAPVVRGRRPLLTVTKNLMTVKAVAERLGVCTATVYKLCERGRLPHVRVVNAIRIAADALDLFIASETRGGGQ